MSKPITKQANFYSRDRGTYRPSNDDIMKEVHEVWGRTAKTPSASYENFMTNVQACYRSCLYQLNQNKDVNLVASHNAGIVVMVERITDPSPAEQNTHRIFILVHPSHTIIV